MYMEAEKSLNSNRNLEKEQNWRTHSARYQIIPQDHSNQNSMVLVYKQMCRKMQPKTEPRNKSMLLR